jgi:hypothetical protein
MATAKVTPACVVNNNKSPRKNSKLANCYRMVKTDRGIEPRYTLEDENGRVICISSDAITLHSTNVKEYLVLFKMLREAAALPVLNIKEHPVITSDAMFDLEEQIMQRR